MNQLHNRIIGYMAALLLDVQRLIHDFRIEVIPAVLDLQCMLENIEQLRSAHFFSRFAATTCIQELQQNARFVVIEEDFEAICEEIERLLHLHGSQARSLLMMGR